MIFCFRFSLFVPSALLQLQLIRLYILQHNRLYILPVLVAVDFLYCDLNDNTAVSDILNIIIISILFEMSAEASCEGEERMMMYCANCGTAGSDDIKLMKCMACHLVRYCSAKCQKDHWQKHKKECKKRAAELHDEILFKQPESTHIGDCPLCCVPLSNDERKNVLTSCCSKLICMGCTFANMMRESKGRLQHRCPFCRKAPPKTKEEIDINEQLMWMKRIEANDPMAMSSMGTRKNKEGDYKSAHEYFTKAAALGDVRAHYELSCLYREGLGVEKDKKRAIHHAEKAAIGGHPVARHNLGGFENDNGRVDRAVKHWIIAANLGVDMSLNSLKNAYKVGLVSKEDFGAVLRGYQAAIEATKSPQREAAAEFFKNVRG